MLQIHLRVEKYENMYVQQEITVVFFLLKLTFI